MRRLRDNPTFPNRGDFFEGDTIDADDWEDVVDAVHHVWGTHTTASTGPHYPETDRWTTSSTSFVVEEDSGGRRLDEWPIYLRGVRPEVAHDDFTAAADNDRAYLVVCRINNLTVEINAGGFQSSDGRQEDAVSPIDTLSDDTGSDVFVAQTYAIDGLFTQAYLTFQAQVPKDGEAGEFVEAVVWEIDKANQSTHLSELHMFGSSWVGAFGAGDAVDQWDEDGAARTLEGSTGTDAPLMRRGEINTGTTSDTVHAVELPDGKSAQLTTDAGFDLGAFSGVGWELGMTFNHDDSADGPIAVKDDGSENDTIRIADSGGSITFEVTTSGGTFSVLASALRGTFNDWIFVWTGGEIRIYQNGTLQDSASTSGDFSNDGTGKLAIGTDGTSHYNPLTIAMPYFLEQPKNFVDERQRIFDWRRSHTSFGGPTHTVP